MSGLLRCVVTVMVASMVSACATQAYTASSPVQYVGPSKSWYKPGVSGKEAWEAWQQCSKHPGKRDITDACMTSQGFKYGKTDDIYVPPRPTPEFWVKPGVSYVDAHAASVRCDEMAEKDPEYLEARARAGMRPPLAPGQKDHYDIRKQKRQDCMRAQGFMWRVLEEHQLPPCWYVSAGDPCRDEPRPRP